MGKFDKGGRGGGGQFFGRNGFGRKNAERNDRPGGPRQMYQAVCSNCGRDCEVPFRPTNTKPVYCNECFAKLRESTGGREQNRNFSSRRPEGRRPGSAAPDQNKALLQDISSKLDKILSLMEPKSKPQEPIKEAEEPKIIFDVPIASEKTEETVVEPVTEETAKTKKVTKKKASKTKK